MSEKPNSTFFSFLSPIIGDDTVSRYTSARNQATEITANMGLDADNFLTQIFAIFLFFFPSDEEQKSTQRVVDAPENTPAPAIKEQELAGVGR